MELILIAIAGAASWIASRNLIINRLRYIDAIHNRYFPIVGGVLAAVVTAFVPFLPWAIPFVVGAGVTLGIRRGREDTKKRIPSDY